MLAAVGAALVAVLVFHGFVIPRAWEMTAQDARLRWRGPRPPEPRVEIVAIDSETLSRFHRLFPARLDEWPRSVYARVVRRLASAGAAGVAFDLHFGEPSTDPAQDQQFARAIRDARNCPVILAMYNRAGAATGRGGNNLSTGDRTIYASSGPLSPDLWLSTHGDTTSTFNGASPTLAPVNAYFWALPIASLRSAAADVGYVDVAPDLDGVYRRVSFLREDSFGRWRSQLAFALFRQFLSGSKGAQSSIDALLPAINGSSDHPVALDFPGPPGTIPRLSFDSVWDGSFDPASVRGKLILVGVTDAVTGDIRPNPYSSVASGVEIHAAALENLLRGRSLHPVGIGLECVIVLAMALLAALVVNRTRPGAGILAAVLTGLAYLVASQLAFIGFGTEFPILPVQFGLALTVVGVIAVRLMDEEGRRRLVEARWSSYVGPDVLAEIMANPALDSGEGELVDATVVFSDIRGYSTLSEQLAPTEVIRKLNDHFEEVASIVFAAGGAILGSTGDGLLMIFGWPRRGEDHADRAMVAARAIAESLGCLNERWIQEGKQPIDIGLGIHSGPVVAGRVGGEQGSQLTVIGDAVNVAARVQDLNKALGSRILMTEETRRRISLPMRLGKSETVEIRGRSQPMLVHQLLHRERLRSPDEPSERQRAETDPGVLAPA